MDEGTASSNLIKNNNNPNLVAVATATANNNAQQRRRPNYFFRTTTEESSLWLDDDNDANRTPRFESGSALSDALWHLLWLFVFNGLASSLLLGVVEAILLPVLLAILELTPPPRMAKLLTILLTAFLFQAGFQGSIVLLLAMGSSSLGLLLVQREEWFVPMFLCFFVGIWTLSRAGVVGGAGGLLSSSSSSSGSSGPSSVASTTLKVISERDSGWRSWRSLWGA